MKRAERGLLAARHYWDVDMGLAFLVAAILLNLGTQHGVPLTAS
jgi:hypothetical protein